MVRLKHFLITARDYRHVKVAPSVTTSATAACAVRMAPSFSQLVWQPTYVSCLHRVKQLYKNTTPLRCNYYIITMKWLTFYRSFTAWISRWTWARLKNDRNAVRSPFGIFTGTYKKLCSTWFIIFFGNIWAKSKARILFSERFKLPYSISNRYFIMKKKRLWAYSSVCSSDLSYVHQSSTK